MLKCSVILFNKTYITKEKIQAQLPIFCIKILCNHDFIAVKKKIHTYYSVCKQQHKNLIIIQFDFIKLQHETWNTQKVQKLSRFTSTHRHIMLKQIHISHLLIIVSILSYRSNIDSALSLFRFFLTVTSVEISRAEGIQIVSRISWVFISSEL